MRRFLHLLFVSLLIVLLPLRGWAGHVMAIDMAANIAANMATETASNSAADLQRLHGFANQMPMPADCAMHSQPATDVVADDAITHCSSCDTCELCLAVTSVAQVQWSAGRALQHSFLSAFDMRFSSAVKTSDLKPPIS